MIRHAIEKPKKVLICPACGNSSYEKEEIEDLFKCKICTEEFSLLEVIMNSWRYKE